MKVQNNFPKIESKLNKDKIIIKNEEMSKNINEILNNNKLNKVFDIKEKKK